MLSGTCETIGAQNSFCVALYEAVYGERPFAGDDLERLADAVERGVPRPAPRGSAVPSALRRLLTRGLSRRPCERWESMASLLASLERLVVGRRGAPALVAGGLLTLGVSALAMATAHGAEPEPAPRCADVAALLDEDWGAEARAAARAGVHGVGLSYGPAIWRRVESALDRHAQAWLRARARACEAHARGELVDEIYDRQVACLEQERVEFSAFVELLRGADAALVDRAARVAPRGDGLARCDARELARATTRAPSPAIAGEARVIAEGLARGRASLRAGRYDDAITRVEPLFEAARALAYPPLMAEAALLLGRLQKARGQPEEAARALQRSAALALASGHDALLFDALVQWVTVLVELGVTERAIEHARLAESWLARIGAEESLRHVTLLNALASLHTRAGDHAATREATRRALQLAEAEFAPDHPTLHETRNNAALALFRVGDVHDASALLEQVLADRVTALGPEHPLVATSHSNLGAVLEFENRVEESCEHIAASVTLSARSLGPAHPDLGRRLSNLAHCAQLQRDLPRAAAHYARARAVLEAALPAEHPDLAMLYNNIGDNHERMGAYPEARAMYLRSLELLDKPGADQALRAYALVGLGGVALALADPRDAATRYEQALRLHRSAHAPPAHVADAEFGLARALWEQDRVRARALAAAARERYAAAGEASTSELAAVDRWLAEHG